MPCGGGQGRRMRCRTRNAGCEASTGQGRTSGRRPQGCWTRTSGMSPGGPGPQAPAARPCAVRPPPYLVVCLQVVNGRPQVSDGAVEAQLAHALGRHAGAGAELGDGGLDRHHLTAVGGQRQAVHLADVAAHACVCVCGCWGGCVWGRAGGLLSSAEVGGWGVKGPGSDVAGDRRKVPRA